MWLSCYSHSVDYMYFIRLFSQCKQHVFHMAILTVLTTCISFLRLYYSNKYFVTMHPWHRCALSNWRLYWIRCGAHKPLGFPAPFAIHMNCFVSCFLLLLTDLTSSINWWECLINELLTDCWRSIPFQRLFPWWLCYVYCFPRVCMAIKMFEFEFEFETIFSREIICVI